MGRIEREREKGEKTAGEKKKKKEAKKKKTETSCIFIIGIDFVELGKKEKLRRRWWLCLRSLTREEGSEQRKWGAASLGRLLLLALHAGG